MVRFILTVAFTATLLAHAATALAGHIFGDVPNSAFYHDAVSFLAQNGITGGCSVTPPLYCPDAAVTRAQVAVFLDRTASLLERVKIDRPFHTFVVCAAATRFAVVADDGTFVRGSAGTTASRLTEGTYVVSFNIDVSACSWQVTVGQTGSVGATTGIGNVAGRSGNANGLFITTMD